MVRSAILGLLVLVSGCAANRASSTRGQGIELTEKGHGLFVGHTDNGDVVVAATHYNAMNGLAVLDTDLGVPAAQSSGMMLCQRRVVTGSHMPHWLCMYQEDLDREREHNMDDLLSPVGRVHTQQGGGTGVALGQGGGTHSTTVAR
jgi:hypothetical protein